MFRILFVSAIIFFGVLISDRAAADEPSALVDRFSGHWVSEGDAFGAPARTVMVWESALNGKFARLTYRIEMHPKPDTTSVFEGTAFYQLARGEATASIDEIKGYWADTNGSLHSITATRDVDALVSYWGSEGSEEGRTRYELRSENEMQVTDWVKTPDGLRQFNQSTFTLNTFE